MDQNQETQTQNQNQETQNQNQNQETQTHPGWASATHLPRPTSLRCRAWTGGSSRSTRTPWWPLVKSRDLKDRQTSGTEGSEFWENRSGSVPQSGPQSQETLELELLWEGRPCRGQDKD